MQRYCRCCKYLYINYLVSFVNLHHIVLTFASHLHHITIWTTLTVVSHALTAYCSWHYGSPLTTLRLVDGEITARRPRHYGSWNCKWWRKPWFCVSPFTLHFGCLKCRCTKCSVLISVALLKFIEDYKFWHFQATIWGIDSLNHLNRFNSSNESIQFIVWIDSKYEGS